MKTSGAPTGTSAPPPKDSPRQERPNLDTMIRVSQAIGRVRDIPQLMRSIVEQVTVAFGADRSTLYLHDDATHELWTLVAQGLEGWGRELRLPDDHGICGRVFQTHESLCIADTHEDPQFSRRFVEATGYIPQSMLVIPIMGAPARCEGVLQLMDRRLGYFSESDLPLLEAIGVQVAICLENARLQAAQRRQFRSFVASLSAALDARDPLTAIHSVNVANYAMGIGQILGLPKDELEWLRIAGLLHDVGKIGVPEAVLTKPGRLTAPEFSTMKEHARHTREILCRIEFTSEFAGMDVIAAAHHEKLDGSGYPDGLHGDCVPLKARILAVADIFDALTQTRHYRRGLSAYEAVQTLDEMTPHQLDPRCVDALKMFMNFKRATD